MDKQIVDREQGENRVMSRRKLLGLAGTAAVAGVLFRGKRVWAQQHDNLVDQVSKVYGTSRSSDGSSVLRVDEESFQVYVDQVETRLERMRHYVDEEVYRVQTEQKPFSNTDGAVTKVLNTGLTYVNRTNLVYGNSTTPFSDVVYPTAEGKYQMDCSSFVQCCVTGTTYENSRYFNYQNHYDLFSYPLVNDARRFGRMLAHHIGKYCYDKGMAFNPKWDWSNLRVGDLVFLYNSPEPDFWNRIGHVMIVSRINQNGTITFLESVSKRDSAVVENTYTHAELRGRKRARLCARLPLYDGSESIRCISYDTYEKTDAPSRSVWTTEPLASNRMYTLFFKGVFEGKSYPIIRTGDGARYDVYSFGSDVKKRPDHMYKVNFFIPEGMLGRTDRLEIVTNDGSKAQITFATLYNGYVTSWPHQADPMLRKSIQSRFIQTIQLKPKEKKTISFERDMERSLDDRYHFYTELALISPSLSEVTAMTTDQKRRNVFVVNGEDTSVTVDVVLTVTQVLK